MVICRTVRYHIRSHLRLIWLLAVAVVINLINVEGHSVDLDDDFAEFEDPDDIFTVDLAEPPDSKRPLPRAQEKEYDGPLSRNVADHVKDQNEDSNKHMDDDTESSVKLDESDPEFLKDDEEFEGLSPEDSQQRSHSAKSKPNLVIAKVPHHLTRSWDNFHVEFMFILALLVYLLNFVIGRSKNTQLATSWFTAHQPLLESNFAIVGDDGQSESGTGTLMKESEHLYSLWCTGRVSCEAMLVELRLVKRQCLLFMFSNWFSPIQDMVVAKVIMEDAEMDGWVMAIGRKRRLQALAKDHQDLSFFCPDKKGQRHPSLPESFLVLNEIPEAMISLLNTPVCKFLTDYEDSIEYLFFSDQYTGPKPPQEDTTAKMPVTQKVLIFAFRLNNEFSSSSSEDSEASTALFRFIFYTIEKVRRIRLNKEAKIKSDANRQRAYNSRMKSMHTQRQEAAQNRRGERMRAAKERIMSEEDPDKARKMEEKEQRKEKAKKFPKMKMLKVKGM